MESSVLKFADENKYEETKIQTYKKAHDNIWYSLGIGVILGVFLLAIRDSIFSIFPVIEPYVSEVILLYILIIGFSMYTFRWNKNATGLSRPNLSRHYISESILCYNNDKYQEASENLLKFRREATHSTNKLFAHDIRVMIIEFTDNIEEGEKNESYLQNNYEDFVEHVVEYLYLMERSEMDFESIEEKPEAPSNLKMIHKAISQLPRNNRSMIQIVGVVLAITAVYFHSIQLGLFIGVVILPLIQRLSDNTE